MQCDAKRYNPLLLGLEDGERKPQAKERDSLWKPVHSFPIASKSNYHKHSNLKQHNLLSYISAAQTMMSVSLA